MTFRVLTYVSSPTSTAPTGAADWSRAAVLTTSPATIAWPSSGRAFELDDRLARVHGDADLETLLLRPVADPRSAARTARSASSPYAVGAPKSPSTASPTNFSTTPAEALELGAHALVVRREDRSYVLRVELLRLRRESDEVDEEHRDEPALLARPSRSASGAPQALQNRAPSGFSWPQCGQVGTRKAYAGRSNNANSARWSVLRRGPRRFRRVTFTTRPELRGTFGMVASTHWLASAAGMSVLERGGNAFDAACATGFVLQVVEPHLNGPGGEVPAVFWSAERGEPLVLCGQGVAPAAATIERFHELGHDLVPGTGVLAACVPGAFGGWLLLLREFGTWRLGDVLEYAIGYAEYRLSAARAHRARRSSRTASCSRPGPGRPSCTCRRRRPASSSRTRRSPPRTGDSSARAAAAPARRRSTVRARRSTRASSQRRSRASPRPRAASSRATTSPPGRRRSSRRPRSTTAG